MQLLFNQINLKIMYYLILTAVMTAIYAALAYVKINPTYKSEKRTFRFFYFGSCAVVFVVFGLINYNVMPVLNPFAYYGVWVELLAVAALGCEFQDFIKEDDGWKWRWRYLIPLGGLFIVVVMWLASSQIFRSSSYNQMLEVKEVNYTNFSTDVNPIPVEKMVVADHDLARKVAEDKLEEDPGLGSRCRVGKMTLQNLTGQFTINGGKTLKFNDDLVWVAPLEHSGFLKWAINKSTPGYMLVMASDPTVRYLITEVNGKQLELRYVESALFSTDIERHIKTSGYATQGVTEHNFEITPDGQPYWVLCNYKPTIVWSGYDAKGVITVNAQTGEVKQYAVDKAPEWVDHIQPEEFITDQITYWGELKLGYWNSVFAQKEVQQPTRGMTLVYSNGQSYYYTGIKSAGGDAATSGFMLVNTRTKEAFYYKVSGVNELEAKKIAEDQNFAKAANYRATNPVLYNVRGIPTYFMTLKGESGNVTGYAFMAVTNRQAVGIGSSKKAAEANYLQALQRNRNDSISDGPVMTQETVELTVRDITLENNTYYVLFEEVRGKEFTGSSEFYRELRWTKKGDKVRVSYSDGNSEIIPLDSFDNMNFQF